jgi:hypothetical protein
MHVKDCLSIRGISLIGVEVKLRTFVSSYERLKYKRLIKSSELLILF